VFLNHGSFGACPKPVFEEYQRWQRELERQPVEFLARRWPELDELARTALASYLGTDAGNLVFLPNATTGVNMAARSLRLRRGDEVLTTDQEYGAVDLTWDFLAAKARARVVRHRARAGPQLADELWAALTPRTRVLSLSHVTSATALVFPVAELCARAREAGIVTIVDGAHAPGQVPVDLDALGADFYAGNCHKWLCAPKGAGFVWVRPELQDAIEPLVVSHGWRDRMAPFPLRHRWRGTVDPSAWLSVPAAIEFQKRHRWHHVRRRCHRLAEEARVRLAELTGLEPLAPDERWLGQMVAAPLPPCEPEELKRRLYDEHRIEIPVQLRDGRPLIRASFQGYNDGSDLDRLLAALEALL
jgi:isopenicillin-N epimerase